jgi:hypothetical protein
MSNSNLIQDIDVKVNEYHKSFQYKIKKNKNLR